MRPQPEALIPSGVNRFANLLNGNAAEASALTEPTIGGSAPGSEAGLSRNGTAGRRRCAPRWTGDWIWSSLDARKDGVPCRDRQGRRDSGSGRPAWHRARRRADASASRVRPDRHPVPSRTRRPGDRQPDGVARRELGAGPKPGQGVTVTATRMIASPGISRALNVSVPA